MKKSFIGKVIILSCLLVFCFSGSVFADPTIDVKITNRSFTGNEISGVLKFDVLIRAGEDYLLNGDADGVWGAMNLRIDIYGEPGITYNVSTGVEVTTHDFSAAHQITNLTYGDYSGGLGDIPGVANTISIQASRSLAVTPADLDDTFTRIGTLSIPTTGGIPTFATELLIRSESDY